MPTKVERLRDLSIRDLRADPEWLARWRARLVEAMPSKSRETVHLRTGIPRDTLDDMFQGRHVRFALSAAVESINLCAAGPAGDLWDELASPRFATIPRPGLSTADDWHELLARAGAVVHEIADALRGDGIVDAREALGAASELLALRTQIDAVLALTRPEG